MVIYKIVLTTLIVSILIFISERKPKIGGLIAGLPIGTGIVVVFYTLEIGKNFVLQGIPFGILGLVSSLIFCLGFYLGGKLHQNNSLVNTVLAFSTGTLFFFFSGILMSNVNIGLFSSISILLFFVLFFFYFFSTKKYIADEKKLLKPTSLSIIFRVCFVTTFIVVITSVANVVGKEWSGILASFPTGLSPVLIVLCFNYGEGKYLPVLKYFTLSITTLLLFYLMILLLMPRANSSCSIAVAYISCLVYVYILHLVTLKLKL